MGLICPQIDINGGRSKNIRTTANVCGQTHQVSVRVLAKRIDWRGSFTIKVPVPFARLPPVPAKLKVYSTSTAFAGSEVAPTNNAMTRALETFGMRNGKNPFKFPTTGPA